jgi:iron complex transport system permease protein
MILAALSVLCLLAGVSLGAVSLSVRDVWNGLIRPDAASADIVRQLRVPRVALGFLVGGSLSVSGAALQALVRNPLADPYLMGLSGGAGLGGVIAIALRIGGAWGVPLAAFAGALAAIGLVYRLSLVEGRRLDARVLLLAGVVVGSFAASLMSAIIALSDAAELRNAFLWLLGGLGGASWQTVAVFAAYGAVPATFLLLVGRPLDLLALGEENAQHLGLEVERTKRAIYLASALLTAAGVATCGIIGFIGLVVPNAARLAGARLHRPLLPAVFIGGGCFLILADTAARTVVRPIELPVGVVTALIGVPLFALLLRRTLT